MYSDKHNIQILIALLKSHGIKHIVLCPGSRNAPIIYSIVSDTSFETYQMTDERSAAFYAIGLILTHEVPVAICCTSGSALLNIYPAVAEAYYRKLPLLVISADRPKAWIGQMDGQTIPQPGVLAPMVRMTTDLPEVKDESDHTYCNRLVNEALLTFEKAPVGPVHINVPIAEPLFDFNVKHLPDERHITRHQALDDRLIEIIREDRSVLLVVGQHEYGMNWSDVIPSLNQSSWVILAEQLSHLPASCTIPLFDTILYAVDHSRLRTLVPEVVITMGGHVTSKRLKQLLRQESPSYHIHVSDSGECIDLFGSLTDVVMMSPVEFIRQYGAVEEGGRVLPKQRYRALWYQYADQIPEPSFDYSEMSAIASLMRHLPTGATFHIGNSSIVRYAQLFPLREGIRAYANRGVNGIEGSLSTAIGAAAGSQGLHFIAIGDLSFFYDMNALWADSLSSNVRILLLNNGGGEIFNALPGLDTSGEPGRFILGRHSTSAQGWAESRGLDYYAVHDADELEPAITALTTADRTAPLLVEVFTDKDTDVKLLKAYYHSTKIKH